MPNYRNLALWYRDLMTTDAKQGWERLHYRPIGADSSEDRFCCLGRACVVAIQNGVPVPVATIIVHNDADETVEAFAYGTGGEDGASAETAILPDEVVEWLGLQDTGVWKDNPQLVTELGEAPKYSAAQLNDVHGYDFRRIAEAIRATWPRIEEFLDGDD